MTAAEQAISVSRDDVRRAIRESFYPSLPADDGQGSDRIERRVDQFMDLLRPDLAPQRPHSVVALVDHVTAEGDRFQVPEGFTPDEHSARCRSCHALIVWTRTPRDKRMPVDADGKSHFATCPQADTWRRKE